MQPFLFPLLPFLLLPFFLRLSPMQLFLLLSQPFLFSLPHYDLTLYSLFFPSFNSPFSSSLSPCDTTPCKPHFFFSQLFLRFSFPHLTLPFPPPLLFTSISRIPFLLTTQPYICNLSPFSCFLSSHDFSPLPPTYPPYAAALSLISSLPRPSPHHSIISNRQRGRFIAPNRQTEPRQMIPCTFNKEAILLLPSLPSPFPLLLLLPLGHSSLPP